MKKPFLFLLVILIASPSALACEFTQSSAAIRSLSYQGAKIERSFIKILRSN